ncbi:MAG TPA: hypothetical protein VNL34_03465 [Candidatus Nitrosotenuis sp.]|nr:hypothetical protein [Candidatus Nitrosotenuis sp.]
MLANAGKFTPFLLGANIIVGSIIILVGCKLNAETRDVDID